GTGPPCPWIVGKGDCTRRSPEPPEARMSRRLGSSGMPVGVLPAGDVQHTATQPRADGFAADPPRPPAVGEPAVPVVPGLLRDLVPGVLGLLPGHPGPGHLPVSRQRIPACAAPGLLFVRLPPAGHPGRDVPRPVEPDV